MKLVSMFLVAVFIAAAGTSFAFADCTAHNKAQLVKNQTQEQVSKEQVSKEQPASTSAPLTMAEKAVEPAKSTVNSQGKK